jgi:hypothetical protein
MCPLTKLMSLVNVNPKINMTNRLQSIFFLLLIHGLERQQRIHSRTKMSVSPFEVFAYK